MAIEKKVLIAEDDDSIRRILVRMIRKRGYEVFEAKDGAEEILTYCNNQDISIILSDNDMPKLKGIEATKIIRKHAETNSKKLYIGLMSGYILDKPDHIDEFIQKPIGLKDTYKIIDKAWEKLNKK